MMADLRRSGASAIGTGNGAVRDCRRNSRQRVAGGKRRHENSVEIASRRGIWLAAGFGWFVDSRADFRCDFGDAMSYMSSRRAALWLRGLCRDCGKNPCRPFTRCLRCRISQRAHQRDSCNRKRARLNSGYNFADKKKVGRMMELVDRIYELSAARRNGK